MAGNDPGTFINNNDLQPDVTMRTAAVDQPALNPVAANTPLRYSPPALRQDDNLQELARGLGNFDSGLQRFLDSRDKQQQSRDQAQAQADFVKSHGADFAQGVQSGTIPASASPAYVSAYKEAQGQLYGQQLEQKFQAAYDSWAGKGSVDDPDGYSKFAQDFFARNIGTQDPDVLKGLMPVVHTIAEHGLRQDIENQHTTVTQGYADTMSATVNNVLAQGVAYANTSGNPVDPSWVAQQVGGAYTKALSVGVKPEEAQRSAIVQITTAALLNKAGHGREILQALDVPMPGTDITLSQTTLGAEQKMHVQNELDTYDREKVLHESQAQKAADKQALGVVEQNVVEQLVKDPSAPINEADLKEGSKYDPTFRVRVLDWQDKVFKNGGTSDPTGLMQLHRDIMSGAGMDSVTHAVELGIIRNPRDLKAAQDEVQEHQKADPVMHVLAESEAYKSVMSSIKTQTAAAGSATDPFGSSGLTPAGLGIQYELNKRMQEWASQNPTAGYNATQEQFAKVSSETMKLIVVPHSGENAGHVALPPTNPYSGLVTPDQQGTQAPSPSSSPPTTGAPTTQPNAVAPASVAPASPLSPTRSASPTLPAPATTAATSGATTMPPPDPKLVQAWAATLSPADQESLARVAKRRGMDPQQLLTQAYQKANPTSPMPSGASTSAPAASTSSQPFGDLGAARSSALTSQPQYQPGAAEHFGDALAKWQASDPNAPAVIHQVEGVLRGIHAALPYQGSTTLAAIKDNPQAAKLLDFVSGPESRGNYNAYYGHGDNQKINLTGMTLNEVLQFQHNLVAVDGQKSSASGRYQFMPKTLQGLIGQMHLTGNERFTPELQDQLAVQLLKNRGLEQWQAGKLDDATFANNLALEWASLPNMHTGQSQYGGDGLNRALVTPAQVQGVLNEAKAAPSSASISETPAPQPTAAPAAPTESLLGRFADGVFGGGVKPSPSPVAPPANMGTPTPPQPAPQANTDGKDFVIGDSVGDGVRSAMKAEGDTKVSRPPSEVLDHINALAPGSLTGRRSVVLSSGYSNNSKESPATVESQIQALVAKGANPASIVVLGVGDRADYAANKVNQTLAAAAQKYGARFVPVTGHLPPGEHVHPDRAGYQSIAQLAQAHFVRTGSEDLAQTTNED